MSVFIMKDVYLCLFWQLAYEFVELSWQHILPHFRECWFDHVLCDVLLSNVPAIFIGLFIARKLNVQLFDFFGRNGKKSVLEWSVWHCHHKFAIMAQISII